MPTSALDAADIFESKTIRATKINGVIVVSFFANSEAEEFLALTKFVVDCAAAAGQKVDMFAIVAPMAMVPSAAVRAATAEFSIGTRDALDNTNIVLLGASGFWRTIVRSIVTNMMTLVRTHGQAVVHASFDAALARVCAARGLDMAQFRALIEARGLLDSLTVHSEHVERVAAGSGRSARRY
jgi:hypothetical protein